MSAPSSITVTIYVNSRQMYSTELTSALELGRQRPGEAPPYTRIDDRIIIAKLEESDISRQHISLHLLPDNKVVVTNRSAVNSVLAGTDDRIQPGEQREVTAPTLLTLFDRVIQLEPRRAEPERDILGSLSYRTRAPGQRQDDAASIFDSLAVNRSQEDNEYLLRGLHATIGVFQLASNSSDFYSMAAQAMIDVVGLETAAALTWDGHRWEVAALCTQSAAHFDESSEWEPSQTILQSVRDEKRTCWRVPSVNVSIASSLTDVKALVAAPILNQKAEVVGALYGDRRRGRRGGTTAEISEVEAILVELLSTSVAAGFARLEQEQAAVKARVLFDQFFTPELSRQLEAEPSLLLGKDTEVSLLMCDIRDFSQVSERLGARLTLDWINDIMGTLSGCIADNHGVLVDTLGDELTGMWGAPVARTDHAELACRAAIQMFEQLSALNQRWQNALKQPIDLAIGVHTGVARVGNIGSERKFSYGPLGSMVQLATRTKRATRELMAKILITGATAKKLDDSFSTRRVFQISNGQAGEPVDLYELAALVPEDWPDLKRRFETAVEAFERGDLPTATRLLAKILSDHPGDRPSLQLLARIHGILSPGNWSL